MKKLSIVLGLIFLAVLARAETPRLNVVDYFLLLPEKDFEAPPKAWLEGMKLNHDGTIDIANGYLSVPGDGAQPEFEVALFRFRNGRPLLAVCAGELEGADGVYLSFYELGGDGKMHPARRSFLPIGDAGSGKGNWRFDLPRRGKTIVVRRQRGGKILDRFTWNGEKFEKENK